MSGSKSHPWVIPHQPDHRLVPVASLRAVKWEAERTGCFSTLTGRTQSSAIPAGAWEPNSCWKPIDLRLLSHLSPFEKLLYSQKLKLQLRGPETEPHPLESFFDVSFLTKNWRMDASEHQQQWRWEPADKHPLGNPLLSHCSAWVATRKHRQVGLSSPCSSAGTCSSACCLHMVEKSWCVSNSSGQRRCCK